ncbi:MAG: glycosyltransferase family 4 protein [Erysipelothrix sp.]|nr:glycosyltransferase family 4 protein [Erysipelothrix sp.]
MKVLLYFEGENFIAKSGIGRALKHQKKALELAGVEYTTDVMDSYDILHINTVGVTSPLVIAQAHALGKKVVYHAHSTEEDFRNSFILSNQIAPLFKQHLINMYQMADVIITPTPYSKSLLENYGLEKPIYAVSNGIDLSRYFKDVEKEKTFRSYFHLGPNDKVVVSAGLYLKRKGILDFMEVARMMPEVTFIWFGSTPRIALSSEVKKAIDDHPVNVRLPGYLKGPGFEGAFSGADAFFFPSLEETEGIVVLEALASKQKVVVRDIGVYQGWLKHEYNCLMGKDNHEFVSHLRTIFNQQYSNEFIENAYQTAQDRSLDKIGEQLKTIYQSL